MSETAGSLVARPYAVWREVDSSRPQVGLRVWRTGGEVVIGRRMYRARWAWPTAKGRS
jgi:hypothetical protein